MRNTRKRETGESAGAHRCEQSRLRALRPPHVRFSFFPRKVSIRSIAASVFVVHPTTKEATKLASVDKIRAHVSVSTRGKNSVVKREKRFRECDGTKLVLQEQHAAFCGWTAAALAPLEQLRREHADDKGMLHFRADVRQILRKNLCANRSVGDSGEMM